MFVIFFNFLLLYRRSTFCVVFKLSRLHRMIICLNNFLFFDRNDCFFISPFCNLFFAFVIFRCLDGKSGFILFRCLDGKSGFILLRCLDRICGFILFMNSRKVWSAWSLHLFIIRYFNFFIHNCIILYLYFFLHIFIIRYFNLFLHICNTLYFNFCLICLLNWLLRLTRILFFRGVLNLVLHHWW